LNGSVNIIQQMTSLVVMRAFFYIYHKYNIKYLNKINNPKKMVMLLSHMHSHRFKWVAWLFLGDLSEGVSFRSL